VSEPCVKFEENRTIRGRVIDDLAHFRRQILHLSANPRTVLRVRGPNFTKLGENTGRSSLRYKFVSEFRYFAAFSNAGGSKSSDVENDAKFCNFDPPCKNQGSVGEIYGQLL